MSNTVIIQDTLFEGWKRYMHCHTDQSTVNYNIPFPFLSVKVVLIPCSRKVTLFLTYPVEPRFGEFELPNTNGNEDRKKKISEATMTSFEKKNNNNNS